MMWRSRSNGPCGTYQAGCGAADDGHERKDGEASIVLVRTLSLRYDNGSASHGNWFVGC